MSGYYKMFRLAFVLHQKHSLLSYNVFRQTEYTPLGSGNKIPGTDQFYSEPFMTNKEKTKQTKRQSTKGM